MNVSVYTGDERWLFSAPLPEAQLILQMDDSFTRRCQDEWKRLGAYKPVHFYHGAGFLQGRVHDVYIRQAGDETIAELQKEIRIHKRARGIDPDDPRGGSLMASCLDRE